MSDTAEQEFPMTMRIVFRDDRIDRGPWVVLKEWPTFSRGESWSAFDTEDEAKAFIAKEQARLEWEATRREREKAYVEILTLRGRQSLARRHAIYQQQEVA